MLRTITRVTGRRMRNELLRSSLTYSPPSNIPLLPSRPIRPAYRAVSPLFLIFYQARSRARASSSRARILAPFTLRDDDRGLTSTTVYNARARVLIRPTLCQRGTPKCPLRDGVLIPSDAARSETRAFADDRLHTTGRFYRRSLFFAVILR